MRGASGRQRSTLAPLLSLLVSVSASACGLAPHEATSTSIPSDGVSGFGDASPIELCIGTASVAPSSAASAVAGVCLSKGASQEPCVRDSACSGIERCICGRCIVEACQGAASCSGGRVCRGKRCTTACSSDTECAPGERCISGGCARACSSDASCHFGEGCDALDGVCGVKLCGGALACGADASCELTRIPGEVHEPALVVLSGAPIAFIEIRGEGASIESGIYRARVDAPDRWTADPASPVLRPALDELRVGAPSAAIHEGILELYFTVGEGASIERARSVDDGVTFERDAGPVLAPAEAWEGGYVSSPSIFDFGGQTYLFYEGGPGAGIGLARVDAGVASRLSSAPVATPASIEDPLFWRGITEIGSPHARVIDGAVRLYFTARGVEGGDALSYGVTLPADRNDSIGLLTSRDLAVFEPYPAGPVFARVTNLRAYLGEREAFVTLLPSGAEILFLASDASGSGVSGLARAVSMGVPR